MQPVLDSPLFGGWRRRPVRLGLAFALSLLLVVGTQEQGLTAAAAIRPDPAVRMRQDKPVEGVEVAPQPRPADPAQARVRRDVPEARWPGPGVAELAVPTPGGDARSVPWPLVLGPDRDETADRTAGRAGDLPVWVAPTVAAVRDRIRTGRVSAVLTPASVAVEVLGRRGDELVLSVRRTDGVAGTGRVQLGVDYSAFRDAYGGSWAARLRLVAAPACSGCARTVVPTTNNGSGQLTAEVPVRAAAQTFGVAAGPSSGAGDFAKADLTEGAARWNVGGSSGDFEWSLPMDAPPAIGGPEPEPALQYSSGALDGLSSATNNQPSIVGQGFDLAGGGAIERRYRSCAKDLGGNNGTRATGDLCWVEDNAAISLNGKSGALVRDDTTGRWHLRGDDGSVVERFKDPLKANGDRDGEYWRLTTTDGTRYFFGLNRLPGWDAAPADQRRETRSAWTVPVFGNHDTEPCHATTFAASWCDQAYQWNLDYVVDRHGNTMSIFYDTETNNYARNLTASTVSSYERGGNIARIEYGQRDGQVYTSPAVGRVVYSTAERCTSSTSTCGPAQPATYPDTPWDLSCASATNCDNRFTPTFWTAKRLAEVSTEVWRAGTRKHEPVSSWTLRHQFLDADNVGAGLWLEAIAAAGHVGTAIQTPEINFDGIALDNRVDSDSDMVPPLEWHRISAVNYGTGGALAVQYSGTDCTSASKPAPDQNDRRCRPQRWTPENQDERPDWFHKYVAIRVTETDRTVQASPAPAPVPVTTTVEYLGSPAWRYAELDGVTDATNATWSQWRGYGRVRVTKGIEGETQSVIETLYFRGMDGDRTATGPPKDIKVVDSTGVPVDDVDEMSGQVREQQRMLAGAVAEKSITDHWISAPTAVQARPWGTLRSYRFGQAKLTQYQAVDGGMLRTATKHTYASDGRLTEVHQQHDTSTTADDSCTRFEYVANPAAGLAELPVREQVVSVGCDQPWTNNQVVSDERIYYDGATSHTAVPSRGNATRGERLSGFASSGAATYETVYTATYDDIGRQVTLTNALGQTVRQEISPAYGPVTEIAEVAPNGHRTTTEYEPAWGEETAVTTPDGRRASAVLDALGRTSKEWQPGSPTSGPPDLEYEYLLRGDDGPSVVTTRARLATGVIDVSHELYDGLLRLRQTQQAAPGGGRTVTEHRYDSRGHETRLNGPWHNDGAPQTDLLLVGENELARQQVTERDALDRPTTQILKSFGAEKWRIDHDVNATRQSISPAAGQTPTTRIMDARGRLVELRQYRGAVASGPDYDKTTYGYNPLGQLTSLTDPAGNVWRYEYDVRGRKTREHDPDRGTTTYSYNEIDQVLTTTDGRGSSIGFTYDTIGRRTSVRRGSPTGEVQVEWKYDELGAGLPVSTTRYVGGHPYTTAVTGYDPAGRPTGNSVTLPAAEGKLAGTYEIGQTYRDDDQVATRTLPDVGGLGAETLTYGYNDQGLTESLRSELGQYLVDQNYTPFEEVMDSTLGTGDGRTVKQAFEYDDATRRLTRVTTERQILPRRISDTSYEYDPAGNITRITDTPSVNSGEPADTQCFRYDYLRRLTEAWTPAGQDCAAAPGAQALGGPAPYWHRWTFDKTGNRQTEERISATGTVTSSYRYGGAGGGQPHTLRSVTTSGPAGTTTKTFGYDAVGNTTSRTSGGSTETLDWDNEGLLTGVTKGTARTSFVYDGEGNRLLRRDQSGTTLFLGETELTLASDGTLTGTRYYTADEQVIAVRTGGKLSWLLTDLHGTPTIAVDAATQAVQRRRTTPYGETRGAPPAQWPGQRDFAGGTSDPSTGLIHLGAREYDPTTGRFISVDPVLDPADPQQLNGYAYANNNPVSMEDTDGRAVVVLVPLLAIAIIPVVIIVIAVIVLVLLVMVVEAVRKRVVDTVWDVLAFAAVEVTRWVTVFVTTFRTIIKTIVRRVVEVVMKMVIRIKWVRKVINQVKKPPRKPPAVKPSPKAPKKSPPKKPPARAPKNPAKPPKKAEPRPTRKYEQPGSRPRNKAQQRKHERERELDQWLRDNVTGLGERITQEKWLAERPVETRAGPNRFADGTPITRGGYSRYDLDSISGRIGWGWKIFLAGDLVAGFVMLVKWFFGD